MTRLHRNKRNHDQRGRGVRQHSRLLIRQAGVRVPSTSLGKESGVRGQRSAKLGTRESLFFLTPDP